MGVSSRYRPHTKSPGSYWSDLEDRVGQTGGRVEVIAVNGRARATSVPESLLTSSPTIATPGFDSVYKRHASMRLRLSAVGLIVVTRAIITRRLAMELLADEPYLYLTTIGRVTGLPRQIEIWFVAFDAHLYVLAEHFHEAQWVKNIVRQPEIRFRLGKLEFDATARVLDPQRDVERWNIVQDLARRKYKWGEGLPVEITPGQPLPLG